MTLSIIAMRVGASLGDLLRWFLGTKLKALLPSIPPGTLAAKLVGGYLIGVAVAYLSRHPLLPPEWGLPIVTGLLGRLTNFSTFFAEVVAQLMAGRMMWALSGIAVHGAGYIGMALLGIGPVAPLRHSQLAGG